MNFSGSKPFAVARFGGLVDYDYKTAYPLGIGIVVKNSRFLMQSVATRFGLKATMTDGAARVTGLNVLNFIGGANQDIPTRFDYAGAFTKESPAGSGTLIPVTSPLLLLPASKYRQSTIAYNREWCAFSDLITASGPNAVFDGATGNLDPISMRPVGDPFEVNGTYIVGEIICPTVANNHTYRVTVGGVATTEPVWPTTSGGTVTSGAVTFTEMTPIATTTLLPPDAATLTRVGGAGTLAAGRDVYVKLTFVSPQGETDIVTQAAAVIVNTVLNDRVQVSPPSVPAWVLALAGTYQPATYRVYEADVATGASAPPDSAYKLVGTAGLAGVINIDTTAAGVVGPTANSAWVTPEGNVCSGQRYMVVLMETRTEYISGFQAGAVISIDVATAGRQLLVTNLFTGPSNVANRICAFTVPGTTANPQSKAGYYFFIAEDDNVQGLNITSTRVAGNAATSAVFNFYDTYLAQAEDVSDFYLKMKVPPCVDIYYSKTLDRLIYTGATGYESGHLVSERADPETVIGGKGITQVAENNGERCVAYREMKSGEQLSFKEGSIHNISGSSSTVPALWDATLKFDAAGACGPRAVAIEGDLCIFAHETGVWKYDQTSFDKVSNEIPNAWAGINWAYKHLIWTHIDTEAYEIRIGVPYGNSTYCNKVFTLNYKMGWDEAVIINMFGKLMPSHHSRKWSLDDITATMAITAERSLAASVDPRIDDRQVLFASDNGRVNMIVPDTYNDNGAAIDWQFQPSYAQEPSGASLALDGLIASARGKGKMVYRPVINSTKIADRFNDRYEILNDVVDTADFTDGARGNSKYFSYLFTNGNKADVWAELTQMVLYARPKWLGK